MVKVWLTEVKEGNDWDSLPERIAKSGVLSSVQKDFRAVDLSKADIFRVEGNNFVWQGDVLVCVGGDGSEVTLSPDGWDKAKALKGAKG